MLPMYDFHISINAVQQNMHQKLDWKQTWFNPTFKLFSLEIFQNLSTLKDFNRFVSMVKRITDHLALWQVLGMLTLRMRTKVYIKDKETLGVIYLKVCKRRHLTHMQLIIGLYSSGFHTKNWTIVASQVKIS